jgi:NAD(P)-dependent dehydrogenase (short-subunit alcohol dehydrogenase family)
MTDRLAGKVAVVTGGASGIGLATAERFAGEGARVLLVDRDEDAGRSAADSINRTGATSLFAAANLTVAAEVESVVAVAVKAFGRVDILVNAAGLSGRRWGDGPTGDCTEEAWDRVLENNLKSVFLCSRSALPRLIATGNGAIVNVASVLGLVGGDADFATHAYAASKGGIIALTRAIAIAYAPRNVRANVICPGLIATPMSQRAQASPTIRERLAELQPLTGDFGHADDVAHAAVYLASDEARFVTGVVHPVDGGWTAR